MASKVSASYIKAVILVALFFVVFIIAQLLNKGFPSGVTSFFNAAGTQGQSRFTDEQKAVVQKALAGFWTCDDAAETKDAVSKSDHIEIKDNGIIWETKVWNVKLPKGDSIRIAHVRTAYVNPFSKDSADTQNYLCEVHTIRQAFISGNDTCYATSGDDELWKIGKRDGQLLYNKKHYSAYKGELTAFFPAGMIHIVDKIDLNECKQFTSISSLAKAALIDQIAQGVSGLPVGTVIRDYYSPMIIDEMTRGYPDNDKSLVPDSMRIAFGITANGYIENPHRVPGVLPQKKFEELLLKEMKTWRIPKTPQNAGTGFTFHFR